MSTLAEHLLVPGSRPTVVRDVCSLIDDEVASKSGLSGLAIRGGYAVVKGLKPGIISTAVDEMLDEFVSKLEPFFADHHSAGSGQPMEAYLGGRRSDVAEALLSITDGRAVHAKNAVLKKTYDKLRPFAKKNVEEATPGIGRLVDRHTR